MAGYNGGSGGQWRTFSQTFNVGGGGGEERVRSMTEGIFGGGGGGVPGPPYVAYVGNLPLDMIQGDINRIFVGLKTKSINLVHDQTTGRFKGHCYVEFEDAEAMERAMEYNGVLVNQNKIRVNPAKRHRQDRGDRPRRNFLPPLDQLDEHEHEPRPIRSPPRQIVQVVTALCPPPLIPPPGFEYQLPTYHRNPFGTEWGIGSDGQYYKKPLKLPPLDCGNGLGSGDGCQGGGGLWDRQPDGGGLWDRNQGGGGLWDRNQRGGGGYRHGGGLWDRNPVGHRDGGGMWERKSDRGERERPQDRHGGREQVRLPPLKDKPMPPGKPSDPNICKGPTSFIPKIDGSGEGFFNRVSSARSPTEKGFSKNSASTSLGRPRLNLLPKTVDKSTSANIDVPRNAAIFGNAQPREENLQKFKTEEDRR